MQITYYKNHVLLEDVSPFHFDHTFLCGQCFRWNKEGEEYVGVAHGKVLSLSRPDQKTVRIKNTSKKDFETIWQNYFDLGTDYNKIQQELLKGGNIKKSVISQGYGIRILRQEIFETVISFLISQNNNIPRIKSIIERLCQNYGKKLTYNKKIYYSFPKPLALANQQVSDFSLLGCGYRDKYIHAAAKSFAENKVDTALIRHCPISDAKQELMKLSGVGPKVADCILLYGASRREVFPADVWMKKILSIVYSKPNLSSSDIENFAASCFGEHAGYAQQYLFYAARENQKRFLRPLSEL